MPSGEGMRVRPSEQMAGRSSDARGEAGRWSRRGRADGRTAGDIRLASQAADAQARARALPFTHHVRAYKTTPPGAARQRTPLMAIL